MEARAFKDAIYAQLARLGKAVAAPKRLELLELLGQGPRTVEALADQAALSVANASQHLKVLRGARLVEAEKKGLYVEYRLASDDVCRLLVALRGLAETRLAEVEQVAREYFEDRGGMEAVEKAELVRRVRRGEVTLVDVRPPPEYLAGHIPGAISIPVAALKAWRATAGAKRSDKNRNPRAEGPGRGRTGTERPERGASVPSEARSAVVLERGRTGQVRSKRGASVPSEARSAVVLEALPRDREIIAYCRGPYCVMAVEAVELLRAEGFQAHRLEEGVVDWRARGWPIEVGPSESEEGSVR